MPKPCTSRVNVSTHWLNQVTTWSRHFGEVLPPDLVEFDVFSPRELLEIYIYIYIYRYVGIWVFPKIGGKKPKWMMKIIETPNKNSWFGGPTPILGNTHIILPFDLSTSWNVVLFTSRKESHGTQWLAQHPVHQLQVPNPTGCTSASFWRPLAYCPVGWLGRVGTVPKKTRRKRWCVFSP